MQDYDQRFVRRTSAGFTSISNTQALCQACGKRSSCPVAGSISKGVECAGFLPVMSFPDQTGLSEVCNTFRKGLGSFRKLETGQEVALYSRAHGRIVGQAVIGERSAAALGELLPKHAAQNHLMLGEAPGAAPAKLRQTLRRMYGANYGADDKPFSVIYLEPVRGDR